MRRAIWEILLGISSSTESSISTSESAPKDNTTTSPNAAHNNPFPTDVHTEPTSRSMLPGTLSLDPDVDVNALAVQYELTGGFIKNAVLSALLIAISRHPEQPVISQSDLIQGCQLQMRGSLTAKSIEEKVAETCSISRLALSIAVKDTAESIIRMERARAIVYGTWSGRNRRVEPTDHHLESTEGTELSGPTGIRMLDQYGSCVNQASNNPRATICAFAGPSGDERTTA